MPQQGEDRNATRPGQMRVDPGDRFTDAPRGGFRIGYLLIGLGLLLGIVALVMWWGGEDTAPEPQPSPPAAAVPARPVPVPEPEPEMPPAEDIPERVVAPVEKVAPEPEAAAPVEWALTLDESDEVLRDLLPEVGGGPLTDQFLSNTDLLLRGTAYVDGLSRGLVMRKVLRFDPPTGRFPTLKVDGRTVMDPAGYRRYDDYTKAIADLDTQQVAELFHRFRPLLETAYASGGNPPEDFDNAVIRALDRIIATPEIEAPIPVRKKEAVYLYVDPELESLAPLQKLMLRTGPQNLRQVKAQARALRRALLEG